jgi:hypothetical protein
MLVKCARIRLRKEGAAMKLISSFEALLDKIVKELKLLAFPHLYVNDDCTNVAYAASLLQISEFQFFQIAHLQWFGKSLPEKTMESFFCDYLFSNVIPHWVRQLSRKVLSLHNQGGLNPVDFDIKRPVATPEDRAYGQWYIIMLLIIVLVFCVLISGLEPY